MTQKISYLFILYQLISLPIFGQSGPGEYRSYSRLNSSTYLINYVNADLKIEFCTDDILRLRTRWSGEFEEDEPYMVVRYAWPEIQVEPEESDVSLLFKTKEISVSIDKKKYSIKITDHAGKTLWHNLENLKIDQTVAVINEIQPEEHFFGFGERMDFMDRRGKKVRLDVGRGKGRPHIIGAYNVLEANYCPVPFFLSTRGYGLFLHNSYASDWDMGSGGRYKYSIRADGGESDLYFIYGPEFKSILNSYTGITGKSPLINRLAFGLHAGTYSGGTWGYEELTSTQYVLALARKFRELGIPIDVLHLDSTWRIFGENGGKGATSFEWRETFDDPKMMFDSLYALNFNMVGVHLRPRFDNGKTLRLLDSARTHGYVYPEKNNPGEFVNFFDEEAVDWWWNNGVMRVASQGAKFLKTDEGSAFGALANESEKTGPSGKEIKRLHNIFPIAYAKAPYEKFQEYNGIRGMNHTREGFAGIQRYPFIFAGDWPSEWQYFEPVIKAGLNIGLSGVGYWAHCMGGFEHPADPELYIRWCQFGLMSPVAHLFGMDHPGYKEPWNYGEEAQKIFKQYDEMRYQLIPYLYTSAWEMYQTGVPLMRALVLEYQDDVNTHNISDQYLLGSSILVCPVTTKGAQTRSLYLPEGEWYNHWDHKIYEGKRYVHVVTPIDQMPIFYKTGSIIPRQPVVQYIDKEPIRLLNLDIYGGDNGSFELYDDDGLSLDYQNGEHATTRISYEENVAVRNIFIHPTKGNYTVPEREYVIRLHIDSRPAGLTVLNGKKPIETSWKYDEDQQVMQFSVEKKPEDVVMIEIK